MRKLPGEVYSRVTEPGPQPELFVGLFSTVEGAGLKVGQEDSTGPIFSLERQHTAAPLQTIETLLDEASELIEGRVCWACLSLRGLKSDLSGVLERFDTAVLCRPQEAILAGCLGGQPGVVLQSQDAFRGMGVDGKGKLRGLAQDQGSHPWILDRARQLKGSELDWASLRQQLATGSGWLCEAIAQEVSGWGGELLRHLLAQLAFDHSVPVSWYGPGMQTALVRGLQHNLSALSQLRWTEPVSDPAQGCLLLARSISKRDRARFVDDSHWRRVFSSQA